MMEVQGKMSDPKGKIIQNLLRVLSLRGYMDVRSACREFAGKRPAVIHWDRSDICYIPDVAARRKGREYIFQVETADTLADAESREKTALFSSFAAHFRQQFCLVVPAASRQEAWRRLAEQHVDERYSRVIAYADGT